MDTTTVSNPEPKSGIFINRNFTLLWLGQGVSQIGDYAYMTTLSLWIATILAKGQSWAPLALSGTLIASSIPTLLLGPVAGVFVDRWDKRHTMISMDVLRAILVALLIPLPFLNGLIPAIWQIAIIYFSVFAASACSRFFGPSQTVIISDIVPEPQRARASGIVQATSSLALILGPIIAAPLLFVVGIYWALILNALSFVVSFLSIIAMRVPKTASEQTIQEKLNFLREFGEGLRFYGENKLMLTILIAVLIVTLGTGALNALLIFFYQQKLHAPTSLFGTLDAAIGAGSILGAILTALYGSRLGSVRIFWIGLLLSGILMIAFARMSALPPALIVFFLVGIAIAAVNTVVGPLVMHVVPHALLGRVIGVFSPAQSACMLLSASLAGVLASVLLNNFHAVILGASFGPYDTIFAASGLLILLGGIYAMITLRSLRLNE